MTNWREETIYNLGKVGVPYPVARKLLRYGATLHRLAEAQCNGDYPADNGERKVVPCTRCQSLWVRSSMVRDYTVPRVNGGHYIPLICRDCRTEELIRKTCREVGLIPSIGGDPRGAVLTVKTKDMDEKDYGIFVA